MNLAYFETLKEKILTLSLHYF